MRYLLIILLIGVYAVHVQAADTCKAMIQANFNMPDGCIGEYVEFTNASASDPNVSYYSWRFGDGNVSNQRNPKHPYSSAQAYTVWLKVLMKNGCTDSIAKVIVINSLPLSAFTYSLEYNQNLQHIVKATPKATVMMYKWTYLYTQTTNSRVLNFVFPADSVAKNFKAEKIVLEVTDQHGCKSKDSINTIFARVPGSLQGIFNTNIDLNYTNPCASNFSIFNSGNDYQFYLTDITGKLVKEGLLSTGCNIIEIGCVGIYTLTTINSNGQYFVNKIIIQ